MDHDSPMPADGGGPAPYPPPFLWLKHVAVAVVVLVIVLGVARVWWGWDANRRLAAELEAIAARGEPVELSYFNSPSIPEDVNAVPLLRRAGAIILERRQGADSPSNSNLSWNQQLPYPQIWHDTAARSIEVNREAIELVTAARARGRIGWELDLDWGLDILEVHDLTAWNSMRVLANQIADTALHHHFSGDDFEAMERIFDVLFIGQALSEQSLFVSHIVACGAESLALHRINMLATGLRISNASVPVDEEGIRPADREQVRRLIEYLLDDEKWRDSLRRALQLDRLIMLNTFNEAGGSSVLLDPMLRRDLVRALQHSQVAIEAPSAPDWLAVLNTIGTIDRSSGIRIHPAIARDELRHLISGNGRYGYVITTHYRIMMERRLMAAALAVRLYHADHGEYPADLESLVPEYLPAVPIDSHTAEGRLIGYVLAADGRRPLVFAVGDEGARSDSWEGESAVDESEIPTGPMYGWHPLPMSPQWRDITAWQDPSPPAPLPGLDSGFAGSEEVEE